MIKALRVNGIDVTAVHSQLDEQPLNDPFNRMNGHRCCSIRFARDGTMPGGNKVSNAVTLALSNVAAAPKKDSR